MSGRNNSANKYNQSAEPPVLVRMLHPTSNHQGFNAVNNQVTSPSQLAIDPRLAMMINMQTQQAIGASNIYANNPYAGMPQYQFSPYMYGIQQSYGYYPQRQ